MYLIPSARHSTDLALHAITNYHHRPSYDLDAFLSINQLLDNRDEGAGWEDMCQAVYGNSERGCPKSRT